MGLWRRVPWFVLALTLLLPVAQARGAYVFDLLEAVHGDLEADFIRVVKRG